MEGTMRLAVTRFVLGGALTLAACGGDDGERTEQSEDNSDGGNSEPSPGKGECSKGEYKGDHDTLTLCGKGMTCTGANEFPIEKLRGYTSVQFDLEVQPGEDSDLSALSCLESVGGLTIAFGKELQDLTGLGKLKTALGLEIIENPKLTSLRGLGQLTTINQLTINFNDSLADIDGLPEGLQTLRFYLGTNANLTSLAGLSTLQVKDRIAIENNKMLPDCESEAFAARFPSADTVIKGNLTAGTCP
jgi:hypothetical protein